jgi:hypothetical protein
VEERVTKGVRYCKVRYLFYNSDFDKWVRKDSIRFGDDEEEND